MTEPVTIQPARQISGSITLPGDKSISHRYAMLAAIAEGTSRLENFSTGADCASTLACLSALGVRWERDGNVVTVQGKASGLAAPGSALDCGNSGSTMRMLSGILAGQEFGSTLIGDESLSRRPMARVMKPLTLMGARIQAAEGDRPPLHINGSPLQAIDYVLPVASAQVKTSLLFAGLFADGKTSVEEPIRTRDHGELALRAFGAEVLIEGKKASITGGQKLHGIESHIAGDLSSAAFFICAAALFPGSHLKVKGLLLNPTRARLLDLLIWMGVGITVSELEEQHGELMGTVQVVGRSWRGGVVAGADTAALIDEIPVLAAIAPFSSDGIEIRDAKELRVKESDRIAAVATNLQCMGAIVEERGDGLKIPGGQKLQGAAMDSYGDHRIAMAFTIAALRAEGPSTIRGAEAASISFPNFYELLESVAQR
jgi:3-phosphoshikimate 1-carboxyvinyltransferase